MSEKTVRKTKAHLAAEARIIELEKQLKDMTSSKEMWYKSWQEHESTVNGLHDILDDLGVRRYRDESKYNQLPLSVRLFAWAMRLGVKE